MFNIRKGIGLIKTNPFSFIFIVIITAFSMVAACFAANYLSSFYECLEAVDLPNKSDTYYFVRNHNSDDFEETCLKGDYYSESEYYGQFYTDNSLIDYYAYDNNLADNFRIRLKKGNWYTDVEHKFGEFNAVISENGSYSVGDLIIVNRLSDKETLHIRVTGILPDNFLYLSFGAYSYPSNADMILKSYNKTQNGNGLFIIGDKSAVAGGGNKYSKLFCFENVGDEDKIYNINYLKTFGETASISEMRNGSLVEIKNATDAFIPTVVLAALLNIASLIAIACITVLDNKKILHVLYYCGARKKDIFVVIASYFSTVFLCALTLFTIASAVLNNNLYGDIFVPKRLIFFSVLAIYFIIFELLGILISSKTNKNLATVIKEE